jgi:hypothetical protein
VSGYGNQLVLSYEQVTTLGQLVGEWGTHYGAVSAVTLTGTSVEGAITVEAGKRFMLLSRDGRTFELKRQRP